MSHTMASRVFSSATGLLALLETFAGVPVRQVATLGGGGGGGGGLKVHLLSGFWFLLSLARLGLKRSQ